MKKYLAIIVLIGLIVGGTLIYNIVKVNKSNEQEFTESGYILQSSDEKKLAVDRFYFRANSIYKKNYGENIEFENTDGEKVEANTDNFIHYSNGAIGAFKNGVLINLNQINDKMITYYNISKKQALTRKNNAYTISHLGNDLVFSSLLWKISDKKYLIASDSITLSLGNEESTKTIKGFVEVEYRDNEVIKIYNQEISFLTISPDAYVQIQSGAKINLSNKIVSYEGENKLSIDSMVIDLDDNVTIADLDQYDEKTKNIIDENTVDPNAVEDENVVDEDNNNSGNTNSTATASATAVANGNGGGSGDNGGVTVVINDGDNASNAGGVAAGTVASGGVLPGQNGELDEGDDDDDSEEIIDNTKKINTPTFKVVNFESTSLGMKTNIAIDDKDSLLTSDSIIEIYQEETGRKVYENSASLGVYDFEVEVSDLAPDTDYTMMVSSSYNIDEINYNKNFIYKTFKTKPIGVNITKDAYTDSSVSVNVNYEKGTVVRSLEVQLLAPDGTVIATKSSTNSGEGDNSDTIEFSSREYEGIEPNTEYTVVLQNMVCEGQIISSAYITPETVKTLKKKPTISNVEFEIDKRNSNFDLQLKNVVDVNSGIKGFRFEIYDSRTSSQEPVMTVNTSKTEVTVPVDGTTLSRDVPYIYKVVAIFDDNEKEIEYESEFSDIMKMDGSQFPTLRWLEEEVTFEKIEGTIVIDDDGNTVSLRQGDTIKVVYKNSIGDERSFTTEGSKSIPVNVNNLRKNETYKFSVYAKVDLNDGNEPIDECYIGSVVVKTKEPANMVGNFSENHDNQLSTFSINFKLGPEFEDQGDLEARTLTGLTFSIYAGQTVEGNLPSGSPKKTVKLVDSNDLPLESELKENYYDNQVTINPEFFSSTNKDFRDKYYTIVVSDAYDYTDYKNALPIIRNVFTFKSKGNMPDLPGNINDALFVTPIRNRDNSSPRNDLDAATIVGYRVVADYNNVDKYARKFNYNMYDAKTNRLIATKTVNASAESTEVPTAVFDIEDGVAENEDDGTVARRGNNYYFTYTAVLALDEEDETKLTDYPGLDENGNQIILKSRVWKPEKQDIQVEMLPLTSTISSYKIAYRIKDIDSATYRDDIVAMINDVARDSTTATKNTDDFQEATFNNLSVGNFKVIIYQQKLYSEDLEEVECIANYFEGINDVNGLKYKLEKNENKISFIVENSGTQIDKVVAYKAVITADDGTVVTKDMLVSKEDIISLKYSSIQELKGKNLTVDLYAYYDSGITGFLSDPTKYVTYIKPYTSLDEDIFYYQIDERNNFINSPGQMGNIYSATRADTQLAIHNKCNEREKAIELSLTKKGLEYDGNVVLQKQVEQQKIESKDGNNSFRFDTVTTEISIRNEAGHHDVDSDLSSVSFYGNLTMSETIADGKITIDLYKTNEMGNTADFVRSVEKSVSDFSSKITIGELEPKTYYFLKFKANYQEEGSLVTKELYDSDNDVSGMQYFFSTLANIKITNLSANYTANSYNDKAISIDYDIDKVTGYSKIEYTLYKLNKDTGEYSEFGSIPPDTFLDYHMTKKIRITPSANIEITFGDTYRIQMTPVVDLNGERYPLEETTYDFTLAPPRKPSIIITSQRKTMNTEKSITFKATVYDHDYVIPSQKYTVQIIKGENEDVTPAEYVGQEYSVSTLRKKFKIDGIEADSNYTFVLKTEVDLNNNTQTEEYSKSKLSAGTGDTQVSIGKVSAQTNLSEGIYRINLVFNESENLPNVTQIKYTVYNDSGYSAIGEDSDFTPTKITDGSENEYYTYLIDNNMNNCANGAYYIEIQFYKDGDLISDETIEHMFIV